MHSSSVCPIAFLATATPSPNDFIELGQLQRPLAYMGYMDMLGDVFVNNTGRNNPEHCDSEVLWEAASQSETFGWAINGLLWSQPA